MATVRNMMRYVEVLDVLARHGFYDILRDLNVQSGMAGKLLWAVGKFRAGPTAKLPRPVRLRLALEELGPTFIKLGQVLSTRNDMLPPEYTEELQTLQSGVAPLPFDVIKYRVKGEFKGKDDQVFQSIEEEPLGSASMAQTHRAVLKDGTRVVIKVLRPGIHLTTEQDMEILRDLAARAEARFPDLAVSPLEVVTEFGRELRRETDLMIEGRACDRFRKAFADDPGVAFPKVFWQATTKNCLALEEFQGILLSRLKEGQLTKEQKQEIVRNGARAVIRQCLEIGFFHADPHPGNLFALPGDRIGFIDCGMTGRIDDHTTAHLADLIYGVVKNDVDLCLSVVSDLTDAEPSKMQSRPLRADVRDFLTNFHDTPLERIDLGRLLKEFFDRLRAHKIRCPADMVMLIKALTTIQGVAAKLDPTFDMVGFARPSIEKLVKKKYSIGSVKKRFGNALRGLVDVAEHAPGGVRNFFKTVRKTGIAINLEHRGLSHLTHTIEHASRNIAFALIIAAVFVGSSIILLADRNQDTVLSRIGTAGFIIAGMLTILMLLGNWKSKEAKGPKA